jgi:redox-sensitive bicupin YhaK (pirin superfamily)
LFIPEEHNAFVYLLDGGVTVDGFGMVEKLNAIVFSNDGEGIALEGTEDTRLLLMTGKPLNEKVVSHGPFVMNTQTEILESMRDYQTGKMGVLIED